MNVFVDERPHALFVGRRLGPWRALGAAELVPLLAAAGPGNLRPARLGAELAWVASVPLPLPEEILARSRARLVEEVERAGVRMHPGARSPARSSRAVPSTPASLALVRSVALARDWSVRGEERLELDPADASGLVLRAAPESSGTMIRAGAGGARLAPGPGVALALAVAALGWNARLSAARLRVLDAERMEFAAECALPADPTEDDVELALDGVLHAAREARRSLAVLAHPAVAREYAAALALPPCVEDNEGEER